MQIKINVVQSPANSHKRGFYSYKGKNKAKGAGFVDYLQQALKEGSQRDHI